MVYFLSTVDPSLTRSGLEKRCHMWWHHWQQEKGTVEWVQLPEQWCMGSRLNRWLLKWFSFESLPEPVQLFLFFSGSPLRQLFRHNRLVSSLLTQPRQGDDIVFLFRAYNIYYLPLRKIKTLLGQSNRLLIDFDESDYLSLGTFGDKLAHWTFVKQLVQQREQLLLSMPNITYYVSGENEAVKLTAHYQPLAPIRVMPNKLTIKPAFQKKLLSTPLRLLLIGTYTYEPNLDMVRDLLTNLLPSLSTPHAFEFHLVGRGLPRPLIEQLKSYRCVVVHGPLSDADLTELYQAIHLNLTLVRFGGGTKYKLVEALAYGIPIIATAASVEGLSVEPMKHYIPTTSQTFEESMQLLTQAVYSQMQLDCLAAYEEHYYFNRTE